MADDTLAQIEIAHARRQAELARQFDERLADHYSSRVREATEAPLFVAHVRETAEFIRPLAKENP